jgi:hypothetical protein
MKILTENTKLGNTAGETHVPKIVDVISVFGNKIQPEVRPQLQIAIRSAISRFNNENDTFKLRDNHEAEADCLRVDFSKGEFVSRRTKTIAYAVNFVGMVIMPVIGYFVGFPGPLVLNFFPRNIVRSQLALSTGGALIFKKYKKISAWTWVLFVSTKRKEAKLIADYSDRLYHAFQSLQIQRG